jgi:hypothetical protein
MVLAQCSTNMQRKHSHSELCTWHTVLYIHEATSRRQPHGAPCFQAYHREVQHMHMFFTEQR